MKYGLSLLFAVGLSGALTNVIRVGVVDHLRCEYLNDPLGIEAAQSRLSWMIEDGGQRSEVRRQRTEADGLSGAGREFAGVTEEGHGRLVGQRQGGKQFSVHGKGSYL